MEGLQAEMAGYLEALPLPALVLDSRGTVIDLNTRFSVLLGVTRNSILETEGSGILESDNSIGNRSGNAGVPE